MGQIAGLLAQPKRHDWETPPELFRTLDAEFGFQLDAAASAENALCPFYFTEDDDGLERQWWPYLRVFCNPPYGTQIGRWVQKGYEESRAGGGATVVLLIPARTETRWWHDYVMKAAEIRFVRGRLRFSGYAVNAPFPSAVVVFRPSWFGVPVISAMEAPR